MVVIVRLRSNKFKVQVDFDFRVFRLRRYAVFSLLDQMTPMIAENDHENNPY